MTYKLFFSLLSLIMYSFPIYSENVTIRMEDGIFEFTIYHDTYEAELYRADTNSTVTIPEEITVEGKHYTVTSIARVAFRDHWYLQSVTLPNTITKIGISAFEGCTSLKNINIPQKVTIIETGTFRKCWKLETITFPSKLKSIRSSAFSDSGLNRINFPNGLDSIGNAAFSDCSFTKITIPSETVVDDYAFELNEGLESATFGQNTFLGKGAFYWCNNLKEITFLGDASLNSSSFSDCYKLSKITLKSGKLSGDIDFFGPVSSIVVDPNNTYYDSRNNCNAIIEKSNNKLILGCQSTVIPNSVRTIGTCAFRKCNCDDLEQLVLPERITSIEKDAMPRNLSEFIVPDQVGNICCNNFSEKLERISVAEDNVTYDSRNNCNAVIESGTNTLVIACKNTIIPKDITAISDSIYYGATWLETIDLPDGLATIGKSAFNSCSNLREVRIPNAISSIREMAYYDCTGLTSIICHLTEPMDIDESVFMLSNSSKQYDIYDNVTLYVPKGTKRKYWDAAGWSRFENIVEMEESLKGDVNRDTVVDVADIASVISCMAGGGSGTERQHADVNGDGTVDVADIATIISIMASK